LRLLLIAPLLAATVALGMPSPAAAAYTCTGFVGAETIADNVVVPDGAFCFLLGTVVRGDVLVEVGGNLRAEQVEFRGSITATDHGEFLVNDGTVRGDIFATGGTGYTAVSGPEVRGDVTLVGNGGDDVAVFEANVRGTVTVSDNTTVRTPLIADNTIRRDLVCLDNTPAPTIGSSSPSTVRGTKIGQCAGL
jgi:hypothetical protein